MGGEISIHSSSSPFLREPFVPICVIFSLFFSFISLKNFHHHRFEMLTISPFETPSFLWASWLDMEYSDELWRILRLLLPQNRIPRRCREGVCPASRFNSGSLASCYWHTVLVTPQVLDFFWLTQKGARPSCDL